MKRSRIVFFVLIAVFFVAVFLVQYNTPRPFIWKPTYLHDDRQPFGCYVLDDVLASSLDSYRVENKTLYEIYMEHPDTSVLPRSERRTYLIVDEQISFSDSDVVILRRMFRQGHNVMLCASDFSEELMEAFGFSVKYNEYGLFDAFEQAVRLDPVRDTIYTNVSYNGDLSPHRVFQQLHPVYLKVEKYAGLKVENRVGKRMLITPAEDGRGNPLSLGMLFFEVDTTDITGDAVREDSGRFIVVATPRLFTNYGVLDGDNSSYIFHLLSRFNNSPVVRLDGGRRSSSSGLLSAIFDSPALGFAFFTLVLLVLLLMANAAQRKQRPIPVVTPPANEMLRFTRLIGNLFYQKRDYQDLLRKKYLYFCTELRRHYAADLEAEADPKEAAERLAARTGLPVEEVTADFVRLKHLLSDGTRVSEADMRRAIDGINHWKRKLK